MAAPRPGQAVVELEIDVSSALDLGRAVHTAVTVHLPDPATMPPRPVVCFAFPGGGYNRTYYTLDLADGGCGQAGWHADRGWIFVSCDHVNVGDSTILDPDTTTYELIAAANAATVTSVLQRLSDGTLHDGHGPVTAPTVLGLGQSMGGCFTIVAQAHHQLFDGVGILGFSAIHTVVPSAPGIPDVAMPVMPRAGYPDAPVMLNSDALAQAADAVTDDQSLSEATETSGEHIWTWAFHHDDEPRELVAQDMDAMSGGAPPPWRSATTPACAILMVAPGTVATEAAVIDVPVLVAVGERDVIPDLHAEPRAYPASPDVTIARYPRMAHMHNFAPTRERLWRRIHDWGASVADVPEIPTATT